MKSRRQLNSTTYLLLAFLAAFISLAIVFYSSTIPDVKPTPPQTVLGASSDRPSSLKQAVLELFSPSR